MGFRTVLVESPCKLAYRGGYLVVRKDDETRTIHLSEISSLVLETNQVYISAYLMAELSKAKIPLVVPDEKHNPIGQYLPLYGAHNTSKRIQEQLVWTEPAKKRVWRAIVREKIRHQARLLEDRGMIEEAGELYSLREEVRSGDTTNREAIAAKLYFQALFGREFSRDDANDLNAFLNYGYAIILSTVNREIVSRGYLTQCGICHRNEFNHFNLACDLMEPFRPMIDRAAVEQEELIFDKEARRQLTGMMNMTLAYRGGLYRMNSVVSLFVQDCFDALNRKIDFDEIEPYDVA